MKYIFILSLLITSVYCAELIHISSSTDEKSLNVLRQKYKTDIIISDNNAYIVPSECIYERYFGGFSQNKLNIQKSNIYTSKIEVTQEIFEAKNADAIEKKIQKQKIIDEAEGKIPKEFSIDNGGHLFGGVSQGFIDFAKPTVVITEKKKHPSCTVLKSSSGYTLHNVKDAKIYNQNGLETIINNFIKFN